MTMDAMHTDRDAPAVSQFGLHQPALVPNLPAHRADHDRRAMEAAVAGAAFDAHKDYM